MHGGVFLRASRAAVWAALHDVDLLASCLPGCGALWRDGDRAFGLALRVGPLGLAFRGVVAIATSDPPRGYSLVGRGEGGRAGAASGTASIALFEETGGCRVCYSIEATTQGLLAALGTVVLTGAGRGMTTVFAQRLTARLDGRRPAPA